MVPAGRQRLQRQELGLTDGPDDLTQPRPYGGVCPMARTHGLGVGVALVTILPRNQEPVLSRPHPVPREGGPPPGAIQGVTGPEAETQPWGLLRPPPRRRGGSYYLAGDKL